MRRAGEEVHRWIWSDSRRSDRKRGLENDLTKEFIEKQIEKGCSYCGETEIRITLDRIDNRVGHIISNVVSACIRCNYVRGNMPHSAWILVAQGMKVAREQNAFDGWTGRTR